MLLPVLRLGVLVKLIAFARRNDRSSHDVLALNDIPDLIGTEAVAYIALRGCWSCCTGNRRKPVGVLEEMLADEVRQIRLTRL